MTNEIILLSPNVMEVGRNVEKKKIMSGSHFWSMHIAYNDLASEGLN